MDRKDWLAAAAMIVGAFLMGIPAAQPGRSTRVVRTESYDREVRKATKKDKHLSRLVSEAEAFIADNPEGGEPKSINRGSRDSLLGRMIREWGNPIYGKKTRKQKFQILYHYDRETDTATLLAFGNHKHLYQGSGYPV
jgi:mRNA-degrading endonuclease RelE of RelBE toxin-antitoxin system